MAKKSNIKNYTSEIPASRSISSAEDTLISIGARNIMKEYDGFGKTDCLVFSIPKPGNQGVIAFKLPSNREGIKKLLLKQYKYTPNKSQLENVEQQAERTAWKNIKEWVELQAVMIKLEQVETIQVFLPYAYDVQKKETLFEKIKNNGFKALSA